MTQRLWLTCFACLRVHRNREHARNTRLRKKAYIETLRQTLQSLTDERDKSERSMKVRPIINEELACVI